MFNGLKDSLTKRSFHRVVYHEITTYKDVINVIR